MIWFLLKLPLLVYLCGFFRLLPNYPSSWRQADWGYLGMDIVFMNELMNGKWMNEWEYYVLVMNES
jgi:hypothetical protein